MIFLSLYTVLLVLVQVKVNGEENESAELSGIQCTNEYPVAHDRERPDWYLYGMKTKYDENATAETCQEWCNEDVRCRSVRYVIYSNGERYCAKFNISVQELKDTGRDNEIFTLNYTDWPTYITYDRDCACAPGFEPTSDNIYQCQPCNNSHYKPNISNDNCQECPQDRPHTAMLRSISKENCTNLFCPPGKYLAENKTCVECPPHTYKEHNDTSNCLNCSSERPHTTMAGTINNDSCTNLFCPPGIGLYGKVCKSCKEDEVSSNGTDPCIQAREGEEPNHDHSKFICSAGYERNKIVDKCQNCQTGYFKSESGDVQPCLPCPRNTEATIRGAIRCEDVIEVGVIIGVAVGYVAVLAAAGFSVFLYCRKHRRISKQSPEISSEEGESKSNDYSDDYSGESGSSKSPTVVLSTTLSDDTTVTTYSCTPTSDSKNTKTVSSTFSWTPRERHVDVARKELFTEKEKENCIKDEGNDWDDDENRNEGRNVDENGDGFVNEDDDGFEDEDDDGFVDKDDDGFVDVNGDGFVDEDEDGDVDEGKDEYEY